MYNKTLRHSLKHHLQKKECHTRVNNVRIFIFESFENSLCVFQRDHQWNLTCLRLYDEILRRVPLSLRAMPACDWLSVHQQRCSSFLHVRRASVPVLPSSAAEGTECVLGTSPSTLTLFPFLITPFKARGQRPVWLTHTHLLYSAQYPLRVPVFTHLCLCVCVFLDCRSRIRLCVLGLLHQ